MPLLPDVEPGLWVNRDYPAQTSGVYALIIGVSRYDHLLEGGDPAPDAYGLGQLSASALTAYKFFSWLRDVYTLDGRPVVRARLLMSPLRKGVGRVLADELENCEAAICAHAPEATFGNCRTAIENWYAEMQMLRASASGRSLFFFSGHGLELRQNYQVLLPSNWLRPPNQPRDEAISTRNLIDCLPYLAGVSSHVLLIDGCRNDLDKLRGTSLTGMAILNEELPYAVNPQFEKAVLYSTASGLRAYSPKVGSLSLFGQALLEGLNNKADPVLDEAPIELNRKSNRYTVEINKLASYMKGRVAALIKAANESVVQVVRSEVASPDPNRPIELAEIPFNLAKAEDTDRFGRKILAKDVMKVLVTQFLRSQPSLSALSLTAYDADDGISQVYAGERVIVGGKPGSDETVNGRSFTWVFVEAIAGPQSETRKGFVLAELLGPGDVEVPSPGAFEPFSTRKTREDFAETCYFQATRNGTNPAYLYALAFALSGDQWSATEVKTNDPRDAPAFGVFRFPTDTWQILLADLKAEDITLEQIKFPDAQCVVAAMLAAKSARLLKTITDRGPSAVDLLLAHLCADTRLFGSEAAAKILQAEQTNVLQPAEFIFRSIYPDVARRAAFFKRTASIFNGDGSATIGEVLSRCATKMEMGFDEVRKLADAVFGARIPSDAVDPRLLPSSPDAWLRQRYQTFIYSTASLSADADRAQHLQRLHSLFGSEAVTYPWLGSLRLTGLSTRQSSDHRVVDILSSAQGTNAGGLHRLQVHFHIATDDPVGHVMTVRDNQGRHFCCVLPGDKERRIFQLEIEVEREGGSFVDVAIYLSPQNNSWPTHEVALAWEQMRAREPVAAAQQLEESGVTADFKSAFQAGEEVLAEKLRAPLAATVVTLLLLKGSRFDLIHDWARNVGNWFPWIPDGVVLWTEQCRRTTAGEPLDPELIPWLVRELSQRSLPFTADGFGLLADIVADIAHGRLKTDYSTREAAKTLSGRVDQALPYFRDNGLFCTFAGWPEDWNPAAILGPPIA